MNISTEKELHLMYMSVAPISELGSESRFKLGLKKILKSGYVRALFKMLLLAAYFSWMYFFFDQVVFG